MTVVIVIRKRGEWDLSHDPHVRQRKKKLAKEVASVFFLVLWYVLANNLALVLTILHLLGGKLYPLWIIYAICTPLIQGLFAFSMTVENHNCNKSLPCCGFRNKNVIAEYTLKPAVMVEGSGTISRALPSYT